MTFAYQRGSVTCDCRGNNIPVATCHAHKPPNSAGYHSPACLRAVLAWFSIMQRLINVTDLYKRTLMI